MAYPKRDRCLAGHVYTIETTGYRKRGAARLCLLCRRVPTPDLIPCARCGRMFQPSRNFTTRVHYCSDSCKTRAWQCRKVAS